MTDQQPEPRASEIPLEDVARRPLPGDIAPTAIAFSPDDRFITYLHSAAGGLERQLMLFDPESGGHEPLVLPPETGVTEDSLTLEEKLRRERRRELGLGVTQYAWSKRGNRILVPQPDGLYVQEGRGAPLRRVLDCGAAGAIDPGFSPDGRWIAFVRDGELHALPVEGGEPRQLTHGARESGRTNGLAEYAAQEEMGRAEGYWWSPDSRLLAFEEADETHIPVYRIVHQGQDATGQGAQEDHRYPFAGRENARVRLGVVPVEGGEPVWMDLGEAADIYLARVQWLPDGALTAQIENREQTALDLVRFDPRTGRGERLLRETSEVWINLCEGLWPLEGPAHNGAFIWASERTGFRHLYLHDRAGQLIRPLTAGDWQVDAVAAVDEAAGQVYFTGTPDGPTEAHLYAVPLAGGAPRRLTAAPGKHAVVIDRARRRFVDRFSALDQPPVVHLRRLSDGAPLATLFEARDPRLDALELAPPELVTLPGADGTALHGAIYRPPARFGDGPFPTLVYVYGGPHAQMVSNDWGMTSAMRAQYLRRRGFLVFVLDNRGSARRGLAFEGAIRHRMGHVEVDDQAAGVRWLVAQGLADPQRVGIFGWSYGGYMALMCLARAPETFRAAVAGAPVTHWDGYDTHYTERYMGTPQSNPEGYAASSVMQHVAHLSGHLLLVHGLIDENVHFRHTARLINALIRARKPYRLLLFPNERHLPRSLADRVYMEEQIRDFFEAVL